MITTVSETFYRSLQDLPDLQGLDSLLDVSVADGSKLSYLGYIEVSIVVPFISDFVLKVPVLVVPDTELNNTCPVIVGTNVLRPIRLRVPPDSSCDVPGEWQMALDSLCHKTFMVKACSRKPITIEPYHTVEVNGFSRNIDHDVSEVVTENPDKPGYSVCRGK